MKENFKRATIELESVKDFYESKQKLFEDQLVSQKEVDDSRRNYEKAISMYNQSKLSYDAALSSSNAKRIYAPISGIILQREIDPKVPVPAGKLLFVIAPDMKRMKLIVNVDESDIGFVKTGLTVEFTVSAYPDKVFSGKITQVRMNPIVIPVGQGSRMVTYESLVECANPQMLLRPGMSATALVNIDRKSNVLRIPNAAFMIAPMPVESEIGKKYVWKKERLSVKAIPMKRVEVKTGLIGDDFTEFQGKDLSEGDEVLVGMHKKFELKGL
jgi:HlyD family secretion protein